MLRFIDWPQPASREDYERTIERTVARLRGFPGWRAVYQIGHVGHPGISDIDLVAVFEDDSVCGEDPRDGLSERGRYLLVHDLWGVGRGHWGRAARHTLFHNYRLIEGEAEDARPGNPEEGASGAIKRQVALEYLVRIFASMSAERVYGIVKMRNLLLHAKALLFDCDFLGGETGGMRAAIETVVGWRQRWFEDRPSRGELEGGIGRLREELGRYLAGQLERGPLYLPRRAGHRLAGNMELVGGERLSCDHRGVVLPAIFSGLGRKYFNLQHRFNRFTIRLPCSMEGLPEAVAEKFAYEEEARAWIGVHLPRFMPFISGIPLA